jgi:hypothetical protein
MERRCHGGINVTSAQAGSRSALDPKISTHRTIADKGTSVFVNHALPVTARFPDDLRASLTKSAFQFSLDGLVLKGTDGSRKRARQVMRRITSASTTSATTNHARLEATVQGTYQKLSVSK